MKSPEDLIEFLKSISPKEVKDAFGGLYGWR